MIIMDKLYRSLNRDEQFVNIFQFDFNQKLTKIIFL